MPSYALHLVKLGAARPADIQAATDPYARSDTGGRATCSLAAEKMQAEDDASLARDEAAVRWVRARIDHEDTLIAHRTTWVVSSQAFLCSAYAICSVAARAAAPLEQHKILRLQALLPWTALLSLVALLMTLASAVVSMQQLRRLVTPLDELRRTIVWGHRAVRWAGVAAPLVMTALFLGLWIAIILQH